MNFSREKVSRGWFLIAILIFFGISALPHAPLANAAEQDAKELKKIGDYIIGAEDVLDISVWKNAELSKVVTVRPDGKISLPLIGDVQAAGLTPVQLRYAILKKLRQYQQTAVASVIVESVNSYRIYVVGEVNAPGSFQLKSRVTVLQAIALAGGFTQFASKNKMVLVRRTGKEMEERYKIRFKDLMYGKRASDKNMVLKRGDTIIVP